MLVFELFFFLSIADEVLTSKLKSSSGSTSSEFNVTLITNQTQSQKQKTDGNDHVVFVCRKELVDPSGLSEEKLKEIPYKKVE